jgi:hypothetical protein
MNWLKALWTTASGIFPGVTSILPAAALAFAVGSALGGWVGYKVQRVETVECRLDCRGAELRAAKAMLEYNQKIAEQDADVWSKAQERTVTRWRIKENAEREFAGSGVPDATLSPGGLSALQGMYLPTNPSSRADATTDFVRAAEGSGERVVPGGRHGID